MPDYDDDREDYDRYDRGERDDDRDSDRIIQKARGRVAAPAMMLIVFGLLGLIVEIGLLSLTVTDPMFMYRQTRDFMVSVMPPGKATDDAMRDFDRDKENMRMDSPLNIGQYVLGLVLSILTIFGGFRMRALKSYGLSLTGAIIGIIPLAGCSCCVMPFGIWAVVVLCNSEVKEAFRLVSRRSY